MQNGGGGNVTLASNFTFTTISSKDKGEVPGTIRWILLFRSHTALNLKFGLNYYPKWKDVSNSEVHGSYLRRICFVNCKSADDFVDPQVEVDKGLVASAAALAMLCAVSHGGDDKISL